MRSVETAAYYNEIEPFCCDWLSNLMDAGLITPGKIDDRSIHDISPDDVSGFRRVHFFAGIAGWEQALNLAGWGDRPVWTGSAPCQPFSAAGKRKGTDDERHLWPEFRRLIAECRPAITFGEQVASKDGRQWLSGVRADLEELGYAVGGADLCAASAGEEGEGWFVYPSGVVVRERINVGAPHIRQRLWWVAESERVGIRGDGLGEIGAATSGMQGTNGQRQRVRSDARTSGAAFRGRLGDSKSFERGLPAGPERDGNPESFGTSETRPLDLSPSERDRPPTDAGSDCPSAGEGRQFVAGGSGSLGELGHAESGRLSIVGDATLARNGGHALGASWSAFDIIPCTDGKSRRVESGSFPLAARIPRGVGPLLARIRELEPNRKTALAIIRTARRNRTGRLKGYGNSIVPRVAAEFIAAFMEATTSPSASQRGRQRTTN